MGILVGFHLEGWDHLIVRGFLASVLGIAEEEIVPDWIDSSGRGWQFVLAHVDPALRRFYGQCAQIAVVGIDNDGNQDLLHTGTQEDIDHPRHWNHENSNACCRTCQLQQAVERVRATLRPLPRKPPHTWPIIVAVPVETVEAWLLELKAIIDPSSGIAQAERRGRGVFKKAFYGQPAVTREAVERLALPLIRLASPLNIDELRHRSQSFDAFAAQEEQSRHVILGPRDCWAAGDDAAERPTDPG